MTCMACIFFVPVLLLIRPEPISLGNYHLHGEQAENDGEDPALH